MLLCSRIRGRCKAHSCRLLCLPLFPLAFGCRYGAAWSFGSCAFDDFSGWADAADEVLRARGKALKRFVYRLYLVPKGACDWIGLGYVGCHDSYECRAWASGEEALKPQVGGGPAAARLPGG